METGMRLFPTPKAGGFLRRPVSPRCFIPFPVQGTTTPTGWGDGPILRPSPVLSRIFPKELDSIQQNAGNDGAAPPVLVGEAVEDGTQPAKHKNSNGDRLARLNLPAKGFFQPVRRDSDQEKRKLLWAEFRLTPGGLKHLRPEADRESRMGFIIGKKRPGPKEGDALVHQPSGLPDLVSPRVKFRKSLLIAHTLR